MFELSSYDIKIDLINELKEYLPTLTDLIGRIKKHGKAGDELKEFYRLVETIRGASSLVKLDLISKVAVEIQAVIEDVIRQRLKMTPRFFGAIQSALVFFDEYAISENGDTPEDLKKFALVLTGLKDLRVDGGPARRFDPLLELSSRDNEDDRKDQDSFDPPDLFGDDPDPMEIDDFQQFEEQQKNLLGFEEDDVFDDLKETPSAESENDWDVIDLPQEELLKEFYQEAEDHFQVLGNAFARLESQVTAPMALTADHKEFLRLIRRAVHTIKGAAAVIRLPDIAAWGHEFEDLLDWLYEQAEQIDPDTLRAVAEATDLLERLVSAPQDVDSGKQETLRKEFKRIIDHGSLESANLSSDLSKKSLPEPDEDDSWEDGSWEDDAWEADTGADLSSVEPAFSISTTGTLRVEIGKIEALVNLASELIIALSGFDDNMNSLNSIIGEMDRSRLRLKSTARDLESGYELKSIRNLSPQQQKFKPSTNIMDPEFKDFDLLELDRYSEFNLLIRSLNETAVDVNTISAQLATVQRGFRSYFNRLRVLLSDLQEKVMRVRMTPMSSIVNRLRNTVRETAAQLQKNVRLAISGEEIELDKRVWETLADPLMHLLRNAIDHGIESPEQREALNKPDLATIQLTASYQGNQVILRVMDDGAGLDCDAIRKRAVELDIRTEGKSDSELAEFIFQPGFSTRKDVNEISGRGVGLDVVQENIGALKGVVQIEKTEIGLGTTFLIRIPLTLAVMRALLFEVNGRQYATALYDIQEILRIHPRDLVSHQGRAIQIGERVLPFFKMAEILPADTSSINKSPANERMLVLVINTGTWQAAVAIDKMHTQKEIVVKNLGAHLHHVRGVAGATIMGDGKVIPILNIEELLRDGPVRYKPAGTPTPAHIQKPLEILVVDDSVSIRMVISHLLQRQGWRVQTAKDGVEAVEVLHQYEPDLVVLDIEMPRMNGYEFMRSFRSEEKFVKTPVIMLTSRSTQKHRDKAENLGIDAFLIKPYEDSDFIALIKRLTRQAG